MPQFKEFIDVNGNKHLINADTISDVALYGEHINIRLISVNAEGKGASVSVSADQYASIVSWLVG